MALICAIGVAAQNTGPSDLDATMKRVGPAAARATAAIQSLRYADAKVELPAIRTGIMESASFFKARNAAAGAKFASDVIQRLEALVTALALAESTAEGAAGELAALDAAMKRIGAAAGTADEAITSMDYAEARASLRLVRAALGEVDMFFRVRDTAVAVEFATAVHARVGELEAILASDPVDQAAAEEAMAEVQGACGACHTVFRMRDADMKLVLRQEEAPTRAHMKLLTALKELQASCEACHAVYREAYCVDGHCEWRPLVSRINGSGP
jgi:hypothetical protein